MDRLTALPPELLHNIFDCLFASHDNVPQGGRYENNTDIQTPLDVLGATCKFLRQQVNDWAQHWLRAHASITGYKDRKSRKAQANRNFLRGKGSLMKWAERYCVFCGKGTARPAILMNDLRCCVKCDKQQWPAKITKTQAKKDFDLQDEHLFPRKHTGLERRVRKFTPLRCGTYHSFGVLTTMFLLDDVARLAESVHGDLVVHRARKVKLAEERTRRKEEKAEKKRKADEENAIVIDE